MKKKYKKMKATLTFNIPEEQEEFDIASNAHKFYSVISEFDNFLRNKIKYTDLPEEQYLIYKTIRQEFWNKLDTQNIKLH